MQTVDKTGNVSSNRKVNERFLKKVQTRVDRCMTKSWMGGGKGVHCYVWVYHQALDKNGKPVFRNGQPVLYKSVFSGSGWNDEGLNISRFEKQLRALPEYCGHHINID